nr:haloacid dehalogenase-like hydrolase [Pseudonocardia acidicola]
MDGTLLRGSSASLELGRRIGRLAEIEGFEVASATGLMDNLGFARACHPIWQTITESDIDAAFHGAPWMEGVAQVWADIAARGEYSAVISMSPLFFVRRLLGWGVGTAHATDITVGGPLDPALVLTTQSKVTIAHELLARYELSPDDCVAYGDSRSDTALFRALRHTVAVNGDAEIRALARVTYEGTDLRAAYRRARTLLAARTSDEEAG